MTPPMEATGHTPADTSSKPTNSRRSAVLNASTLPCAPSLAWPMIVRADRRERGEDATT
jgi:hypothetical protein